MIQPGEPIALSIPVDGHTIQGDLAIPAKAKAIVVFAHGSESSRHSSRNKYVAGILNQAGLATFLIDLLTANEELIDSQTSQYRFDIDLLATRLVIATDWLLRHPKLSTLPLGYFGSSTGAGAALVAAAERSLVGAVVSRGGRPDLAEEALSVVTAPTLLIVGEFDQEVLELNWRAAKTMPGIVQIEVVPGATHLFEESGALERVAALARAWFTSKLVHKQAS